MKHIDNKQRQKIDEGFFADTSSVLSKAKPPMIDAYKYVCRLPQPIYDMVNEIVYREDITMRSLINESITRLIDSVDKSQPVLPLRYPVDWSGPLVHSSIFFCRSTRKSIRAIKHYSNISINKIIVEGVLRYIHEVYSIQYPDIINYKVNS